MKIIFSFLFLLFLFSCHVNAARKFDPNRPTMSNQGQLNNQQRRINEEVVNSQRNTEFLIIH
ncbi:hypothetical protein CRE_02400 [Caenorhabditis remanei]|uniref:Uncharacterized protein n=1 Tax=Caenorhabditis remanei TaxID=31234 RepID=E3MIM0_CAERE|nr:hypothetical protein CRE_02400 [Caenorhabditis remanei]